MRQKYSHLVTYVHSFNSFDRKLDNSIGKIDITHLQIYFLILIKTTYYLNRSSLIMNHFLILNTEQQEQRVIFPIKIKWRYRGFPYVAVFLRNIISYPEIMYTRHK